MGAAITASNPLVTFAPIALGYFMGDKINAPIMSAVGTKVDGKIVGAAEAGLGAYLSFGQKGVASAKFHCQLTIVPGAGVVDKSVKSVVVPWQTLAELNAASG